MFAIREPHVVDRMLDCVQSRTRCEHPAGEDAFDLALQRHLVDLDEGVGVRRFGGRAGVADPRRHLQRAELYRLADRGIEADDAAGDFIEAGEQGAFVRNLLRRRLRHDVIAGLRRHVGGLWRATRRALAGRQASERRLPAAHGVDRRCGSAGHRCQRLRLHGGLTWARILLSRILRILVVRTLLCRVLRLRRG